MFSRWVKKFSLGLIWPKHFPPHVCCDCMICCKLQKGLLSTPIVVLSTDYVQYISCGFLLLLQSYDGFCQVSFGEQPCLSRFAVGPHVLYFWIALAQLFVTCSRLEAKKGPNRLIFSTVARKKRQIKLNSIINVLQLEIKPVKNVKGNIL